MYQSTIHMSRPAFLLLILLSTLLGAAVAGAVPPAGRTYEVSYVIPGGDGMRELDCWSFTQDEICSEALESCGELALVRVPGEPASRPAFTAVVPVLDTDGTSLVVRIRGFAERRGQPASSLGGVAAVTDRVTGKTLNFGFVGLEKPNCRVPRRDSIGLVSISPSTATPISAGTTVQFRATVRYSLASADSGRIAMVVQDQAGNLLSTDQPTRLIPIGSGTVDLADEISVPSVGVTLIRIFFPLFPEGSTSTNVVEVVTYTVN